MGDESLVRRAASALSRRLPTPPKTALILGSGLGGVDLGRVDRRIPYARVPGFPRARVGGHDGVLEAIGPVLVLRGRAHYYEGRTMDEVTRPVRVLARLGVRTLLLTNAAGSVRRSLRPGDLMVIRDHLNLMGISPLRGGPRFVDLSESYDAGLRRLARRSGAGLREGVYAAVAGPSYETPAEIRMLRTLGADAVGMSTVPETIAAREAGLRVLGISLITNRGAGLSPRPLSHDEVLRASTRARGRLEDLLRKILAGLPGRRPS
jgi:purine-nucleoside phosphorylase